MKDKNKHQLILFVIVVAVLLSALSTYFKLIETPSWFNGRLESNHLLLLDNNFTNNEQSRLLQFYIPELFRKLFGLSIINAYILQRFIFTALTFIALFFFSKKWFSNKLAFLSLILFTFVLYNTNANDLQESATLLSLTFLGVLWTIRENKTFLYVIILIVGSINNETMLFLPAVYFLVNFKISGFKPLFKLGSKTVILAIPAFVAVGIIRYINIDSPHLGGALHFTDNLRVIHRIFWAFNIMWFLMLMYFRRKPIYIQRALLSIPLFILPHMITGKIHEIRQMIPLAFIVIPATIFTLLELYKMYKQKVNKL